MYVINRFLPLVSGIILLLLLSGLSWIQKEKRLIYNYTDSLPHGFYFLEKSTITKGALIAFIPPENIRKIMTERGYLKDDGYLMKYVAAEPGDSVSTTGHRLVINGDDFGQILPYDQQGRVLPKFHFNGRLKQDYLVAVKGKANSFDSRYYGPIRKENVIGIAQPLWLLP